MVEQVGRYKIERELGRGGMGVVYLASDPALGRKVAIKTVHFEITDASQREYLRSQLLRDARASAGLSHPNIVNVHDIIESGDTTYLVMEYVAGETLSSRMGRTPAPDSAWLLRVLRDTATALDYIHRKGLVHRDIKPCNIMIDQHGRVRIMDFGLARAANHHTTTKGLIAGTIQYMSPEQIRGDSLDGRTDQFSMAAVAYEMLTGKPLFEARTAMTLAQKIVNETPAPAHVQNPALPENTSAVLGKALDRQPSGRYPTCTAFAEALIATFDGATVQAVLRAPEDQPTIALTGMVDVGMFRAAQPSEKLATAPVEKPGKWSGHAPLLIATGLILGTLGVTAVTLINGRNHGEAPKRPQQPYGPPPLMGSGPRALPEKLPVRPPMPPRFSEPPGFGGVPGNPRQKKDEPSRPEAAGPRPIPGLPAGLPLIEFPDFSKELRRPEAKILEDGRKQLAERNFGIAAELFTAAITLSPKDYLAYFYRGAAYLGAGNPKQAQADYEKVVQLQPDYAQGWYQLGVAMEHQHRSKEALDNYAHASSLKPDMADAFYAEAMVHDQQQALKKALEKLDMAIAANPKYFRGYQARGEIKKRLGDPTFADDLQKAKELAGERRGGNRHGPPDKER